MADVATASRGLRKQRRGIVSSRSGDKTIVVTVERRKQHPLYGKTIKQLRKYHVHDEQNTAAVGDAVRIVETRPLSRLKRWRLAEVLKRAET